MTREEIDQITKEYVNKYLEEKNNPDRMKRFEDWEGDSNSINIDYLILQNSVWERIRELEREKQHDRTRNDKRRSKGISNRHIL